jgi:hypothetical protein
VEKNRTSDQCRIEWARRVEHLCTYDLGKKTEFCEVTTFKRRSKLLRLNFCERSQEELVDSCYLDGLQELKLVPTLERKKKKRDQRRERIDKI